MQLTALPLLVCVFGLCGMDSKLWNSTISLDEKGKYMQHFLTSSLFIRRFLRQRYIVCVTFLHGLSKIYLVKFQLLGTLLTLKIKKIKIKKPYLTPLIMKQTTLAHKLFCDITISLTDSYLPYSIFLAQPLYMRASARELLVPFLQLWYGAATGIEPKTSSCVSGRSTN